MENTEINSKWKRSENGKKTRGKTKTATGEFRVPFAFYRQWKDASPKIRIRGNELLTCCGLVVNIVRWAEVFQLASPGFWVNRSLAPTLSFPTQWPEETFMKMTWGRAAPIFLNFFYGAYCVLMLLASSAVVGRRKTWKRYEATICSGSQFGVSRMFLVKTCHEFTN